MKVSIFKIPPNLKTIDSIFIFNFLSLSFYKEEFMKLPWYPPIILNLESVNYGALDLVNNVWNLYHTYLNLWLCKEIEKNLASEDSRRPLTEILHKGIDFQNYTFMTKLYFNLNFAWKYRFSKLYFNLRFCMNV